MERITLETIIPTSKKVIFEDWLSSEGHSRMTGGDAIASKEVGFKFSAWNDYISGENLKLIKNNRIEQSWRTTEFPENAPDSIVQIILEQIDMNQTKLILIHSNLQPGDGKKYSDGWKMHYFEPMIEYYSK